MFVAAVLLVAETLLEFGYIVIGWSPRLRQVFGSVVLLLLSVASLLLLVHRLNLFTVLLVMFNAYRGVNVLRIIVSRIPKQYLRSVTQRTFTNIVIYQVAVVFGWIVFQVLPASHARHDTLILLTIGQLISASVLFVSSQRSLRKTDPPAQLTLLSDQELPTVSICIPARNETDMLEACLQSLITSDYPKLEILVLDDCSAERRTPEIIRDFAHAGVEFVAGTPPPKRWLAKNWAYEQLAKAANGEVLLFCGVDIRLEPHSLRQLVSLMAWKRKNMLSVMPEYALDIHWPIVQSLRYYWELAPPRRLVNRPPVLSSCWLITKQALHDHGNFTGEMSAIAPEAGLARSLLPSDAYSLMRSAHKLGVTSYKAVAAQHATAVRTRYPQLHKRPELVALLSLAELTLILGAFMLAIAGWWLPVGTLVPIIALSACLGYVMSYLLIVSRVMPTSRLAAIVAFPIVVIVDIFLLHISMYGYEFSTIDWKGRNVCLPVMKIAT